MNTVVLDVQILLDIVNIVSRGVLERRVRCSNHGATWGGIDVTSVVLINFIYFILFFKNLYEK